MNLYQKYIKHFKKKFNCHPTKNNYQYINILDELQNFREIYQKEFNEGIYHLTKEHSKEVLDKLEIITFQEFKNKENNV